MDVNVGGTLSTLGQLPLTTVLIRHSERMDGEPATVINSPTLSTHQNPGQTLWYPHSIIEAIRHRVR